MLRCFWRVKIICQLSDFYWQRTTLINMTKTQLCWRFYKQPKMKAVMNNTTSVFNLKKASWQTLMHRCLSPTTPMMVWGTERLYITQRLTSLLQTLGGISRHISGVKMCRHRRTRRGVGGAAAPSGLKIFRANSVFRESATCSKILNDKKYIFSTVNSGHPLFFRASASCSKLLNVKVYSTQR